MEISVSGALLVAICIGCGCLATDEQTGKNQDDETQTD